MVGGLVDEEEALLPQEEDGQEHLGPLPVGEAPIGAVQDRPVQLQSRQLPLQLPGLAAGGKALRHLRHGPLRLLHRVGEVGEVHGGANLPLVGVLPQQEPEEGGLSPAVPAHEAQAPVGVDLEADVLKDILIAAVVGKGQVLYVDEGHGRSPFSHEKTAAGMIPQPRERQKKTVPPLLKGCFPRQRHNDSGSPPLGGRQTMQLCQLSAGNGHPFNSCLC